MPKKKAEIRCFKITTSKDLYDVIMEAIAIMKKREAMESGQQINDARALEGICTEWRQTLADYGLKIIEE